MGSKKQICNDLSQANLIFSSRSQCPGQKRHQRTHPTRALRRAARPRLLSLCSTISFLGDELILIVVEIVYPLTAIRHRTGAGCGCWFLSAATAWKFFVVMEETCHHHLPACADAPSLHYSMVYPSLFLKARTR